MPKSIHAGPIESRLARLLAPIATADFIENYWEKKPLVISHRSVSHYDDVLTVGDLDSFLSRTDLRYPAVQLVKEGRNLALDRYSRVLRYGNYASEGLIDVDRVFREFDSGATVICQLIQQSIQRTELFISELAREFGFRLDAHAFVSPQSASGLTTHYDTTSSFILQIFGKKRWGIYRPTIELPLVDHSFNQGAPAEFVQTQEIVLEPGDLLYLPRGVPHRPVTLDVSSIHLTIVLFAPTWIDILNEALSSCTSHRQFRWAPQRHEDYLPDAQQALMEQFASESFMALRRTMKSDAI